MGMSIRNSVMRGMSDVGRDLRATGKTAGTGKNSPSSMTPTDLVKSSVLAHSVSAFNGALGNISTTRGKLDVLSDAISSQLGLVRAAYDLAVEVETDITLTVADRAVLNLQYQALMGANLDAVAGAAKDVTGTALNAAPISAVVGAAAADVITLAAIDIHGATLFIAAAAGVSAGGPGDITSVANATTAKTMLALADGILSGHLAKIEQFRELISNKAGSIGNIVDDMEGQLSDIQDADPIVQAQKINDAEQRTALLGSLLAADAAEKKVVTAAAREILAL